MTARALPEANRCFVCGPSNPIGLHWGMDGLPQAYYRGLGFTTERVYLFFEKSI